ncbi:hypothetical protein ACEWY4_011541 [Coilia grayii]|uniref:Gypsy retrotransposon integrase-like protein 1 n=1 Tax=Coilia grayii TaxID=363190 RepID=A0ABD1JYD0_9TELE
MVCKWEDFEAQFVTAFLAEDYQEELEDRVRSRVQGERESIRDFVYNYHALCRKWKPGIGEEEVIQLVLKNLNPQMASQLRGRVSTVGALVRLGQQLEKDKEKFEQRQKPAMKATTKSDSGRQEAPPPKQTTVFCWRCKEVGHPPGSCPKFPYQKGAKPGKHAQDHQPSVPSSGPQFSLVTHADVDNSDLCCCPSEPMHFGRNSFTVPRQLTVPLTIGNWSGIATLDTGASFSLMNERLWKDLRTSPQLNPWSNGPLFLADGSAKHPLGWMEQTVCVSGHQCDLPCVVLPAQSLAFPLVLGLDFISNSGMQLNVKEQQYWFSSTPQEKFNFLTQPDKGVVSTTIALFSAVPPPAVSVTWQDQSWDEVLGQAQLSPAARSQLCNLLQINGDVCTAKLGRTTVLRHHIVLTQGIPIRQKPYRISPAKQAVVKGLVQDMLDKDIIEPSSSPYAAPVVIIPRKVGKPRFCVDYRRLNAITLPDAYPLPTIHEILESLAGATIFSTIDLNSGYWQVEMAEESQLKTAFVCSEGQFHFKVMPFGLRNAPASFQRLMETVLVHLKGRICFMYLDDIIIYSRDVQQHLQDIQQVFCALRKAGLTVNMKKSQFCRKSLKFLGHLVSAEGIQADPEKITAVQQYPVPTTLKALQRFLGMAGWYHRFVPNFSQIAVPLNALKRKGAKFRWTQECQQAFEELKQHLVSPPVLGHPNFSYPFIVYTDASEVGLGAVLTQSTGLGKEEVLAFASRSLNSAERNYSATELECLAVVWALERWRYYLEGRHFTVVTDHASLVWVFQTSKPSSRLIRWALRLQEFSFSIEYRKGKYNTVPDALSRAPPLEGVGLHATCATVLTEPQKMEFPVSDEGLWKAQQDDPEVFALYESILEDGKRTVNATTKMTVLEDKVYRVLKLPHRTLYQVYVPLSLRPQLLQAFHDDPLAGHLGRFKTYRRLYSVAYWPNLSRDVKTYLQNCPTCQMYKPEGRKAGGKLQQTVTTRPWEMLGVDIMGPLPRSSRMNEYLLVFVDYYSRWVELFPLRQATGETISKILVNEVLTRWGTPQYLLSDQGSQFVSTVMREIFKGWSIHQRFTSAYYPQTNLTERVNRTLKTMIASYVGLHHKRWDLYLPEFRFAINSAVQETTGVTPAELNINRVLRCPLDNVLLPRDISPSSPNYEKCAKIKELQELVSRTSYKAKLRQKRNYDKQRRDLEFEVDDRVWRRTHPYSKAEKSFSAKLAPKWQGPYRVVNQTGPLNYQIVHEATGEDMRVVHVSQLKPCFPTAKEYDELQRRKVMELFAEESDEEDFLGFGDEDIKLSS